MLETFIFIAGLFLAGWAIERMKINTYKNMSDAEFKQFKTDFRLQYNTPKA